GNVSAYGWQYLFQGGRLDSVTGWYRFGARDYEPADGVWAERDPLGLAAGDLNEYRFVGGNPVDRTDPSGLWWGPEEYLAARQAFGEQLFVNELYGGGKALVTGQAGRALGERAVGIVQNGTGSDFSGTVSEW